MPKKTTPKELGKCFKHGEPLTYWSADKGKKACEICRRRELFLRLILDTRVRIQECLKQANIPLRFKDKTFSNYKAESMMQKENVRILRRFINQPDNVGLLMIGANGTGKTHLAIATLKEIINKTQVASKFTEAIKIVRSIKDSWIQTEWTEREVIEVYTLPYLLVIDEVGVQFGSETERQYLTEVINDRYNAIKPTILMGNVDMKELKAILGDRVIDRFKEGGEVLVFDWESYRVKKTK